MKLRNFFVPVLLGLFSGCAVIEPYIQEFNVVPVAQEVEIGRQMASEVARQMVVIENPSLTGPLRSMGNRLVSALPRRDFDYQFFVVQDASPNAFTIPGGSIYVHTGLLNFVSDASELAGVLGHEIGHAYERHPARSISRAYGVDRLSSRILNKEPGQLTKLVLEMAKGGLLSRYGREDERRADDIGHELLRRSGYKTDGLLRFLRKLQSLEKPGGRKLAFLASHPPTPERVARLEALEEGNRSALNALL